jgi:hypothetical protein
MIGVRYDPTHFCPSQLGIHLRGVVTFRIFHMPNNLDEARGHCLLMLLLSLCDILLKPSLMDGTQIWSILLMFSDYGMSSIEQPNLHIDLIELTKACKHVYWTQKRGLKYHITSYFFSTMQLGMWL